MSARRATTVAALAACWLGVNVGSALAAGGLVTGFATGAYGSADSQWREMAFDRSVEANAGIARIDVVWRAVAPSQPTNAADPADAAYDFSSIDRAVIGATANGLEPMLTVYWAPDWAEGPSRGDAHPGVWKPDPHAFAGFGRALATRYSGSYQGLPRVRYFEAWNEPNLPAFLYPQWRGTRPVGPDHYRAMLNAYYEAIKQVEPTNQVIAGALAPYGDPPKNPDQRMRPVRFLEGLLCLRPDLSRAKCAEKPAFDILSDHPIDTAGGPKTSALSPGDAATPDLHRLTAVLRAAERHHTIGGGRRHHPIWATEIWWEANLSQQARWSQQALYVLWKQGAKVVINLPLIDSIKSPRGVLFPDGAPKPSFTAWGFPFVTERKSRDRLLAWGKAPAAGRLVIERKAGTGWRRVKSLSVADRQVFTTRLALGGHQRLRASVAGQESLVWVQR